MLTRDLQNTLTLVLAGGQGGRLKPLTDRRAKPAVPFGGAYRIIDFTLSNCIHSGLRRIFVLTQYQALALEEHLRFAWNFLPRRLRQYISALAPHHLDSSRWYSGTADALYHNLDTIREEEPERVLILSGDHIYKMDYGLMMRRHAETGAALTVGAIKVPASEGPRFGIFGTDAAGRAVSFEEKPDAPLEIPGEPGTCLGSMGIYLFEADELMRRLEEDAALGDASSHDFGKDIIPRMVRETNVQVYPLPGLPGQPPYWRDVGTIESYFEANLDLCAISPKFNLYDTEWPIYTLWPNDPPAKTVLDEPGGRRAEVVDSLLCPGVVVSGGTVRRSVLGPRVFVEEGAEVVDSILFSGVVVGKGAKIKRAIIDKWTNIPAGGTIGYDLEKDCKRFTVSPSGIVVIAKAAHIVGDMEFAGSRT